MTASRFSRLHCAAQLTLAMICATSALRCAAPHRDDDATSLVSVSGDFLPDGSCRVTVNGATLFAATDHSRTSYDAGPIADIAPAGYTLHQLTCAPADADPARQSDQAGDRAADERMVIVTLYTRTGTPLHAGRYAVREVLTTPDDTAGAAARAGIAVFGAPASSRSASSNNEAQRAGVRYLEGRSGTLTITSVGRGADDVHVIGTFSARASPAWSM